MQNLVKQFIELEKAFHTLVMQVENQWLKGENQVDIPQFKCPLLPPKPDIHYAGEKIEILRILYALCLLNRFKDSKDKHLANKEVFKIFGELFDSDFSQYSNSFSQSKRICTDMDKQTKIFRELEEAYRKHFDIL